MASLDDAYASAAATKRRLQEEGQEQSPFLPFLNQAATDLTEDTKLSNMLDPDYVESGIGSIIGLVAPQLKENVLERKLAERAEMDLKLFESQRGRREAEEQERVQNNINGNAAIAAAALKKDWDLNGQPLVNTIADPAFSTSIFDYFAKNNNKAKFDILRKLSTEGRKLRLEDTPITGAGTPLFSFQQDGKTWNAYDPNRLEQDKYQLGMKKVRKYINDNITTESGLSQEIIDRLKSGTLTYDQKDIVRNNTGYKSLQKDAMSRNQNVVLNYPPIANELNKWQADYEKAADLNVSRLRTLHEMTQRKYLEVKSKYEAEKDDDSQEALDRTESLGIQTEALRDYLEQTRIKYGLAVLATQSDKFKKRSDLAIAMVAEAHRRSTSIYAGNVESIRREAEKRLLQENLAREAKGETVSSSIPPVVVPDSTKATTKAAATSSTFQTQGGATGRLLGTDLND